MIHKLMLRVRGVEWPSTCDRAIVENETHL